MDKNVTKRPWFVSKEVPSTIFAEDENTKVVVSVNGKMAIPMHDHDAQYIVQCVNSHEELLEAAKKYHESTIKIFDAFGMDMKNNTFDFIVKLEQAIEAAERKE